MLANIPASPYRHIVWEYLDKLRYQTYCPDAEHLSEGQFDCFSLTTGLAKLCQVPALPENLRQRWVDSKKPEGLYHFGLQEGLNYGDPIEHCALLLDFRSFQGLGFRFGPQLAYIDGQTAKRTSYLAAQVHGMVMTAIYP